MVAGVKPREASDRLIIFQNTFDTLYRKYITYTGGEELFGLPVTANPQLLVIKKELNLLQKLYGLYNNVIETVNGYYDILWAEVDIEKINNDLQEFQNKYADLSPHSMIKISLVYSDNPMSCLPMYTALTELIFLLIYF